MISAIMPTQKNYLILADITGFFFLRTELQLPALPLLLAGSHY
jgi:hypothetical protein